MADYPKLTTKQLLYDRIRATSKDEVIVEEMVRLGFWDLPEERTAAGLPEDPSAESKRIGELERQLQALAEQGTRLRDPEAAKAELTKQRMAASRQRRAEKRREREERRRQRAAAWRERKKTEILFLGAGVSTTLQRREGRAREGLPDLQDPLAIARAMGVALGELRFLAFHRKVSRTSHWRRFTIPKKTGGVRLISAPMPRLKASQHWVLHNVLEKVPIHDAAHGFVRGRSIVTNAQAHVGRDVVVNFDLRDFFPTLTWVRVRGVFRALGYSGAASTVFALLCTEAPVDEVELDGRRWFVHAGERHLPQGAPTSPAITNIVCLRLDQRLTGLARSLGFTYTRYADDLTFSGSPDKLESLLGAVRAIVADEGFAIHPAKTRVMRKGARQEVTGLVVNRRVGVPRELVRAWRAVRFQVERDGPAGKRLGASTDVIGSLLGFAAFVRMVEPDKGTAMLADARALAARTGWSPSAPAHAAADGPAADGPAASTSTAPADPVPAETAAAPNPPSSAGWWKFWRWFS